MRKFKWRKCSKLRREVFSVLVTQVQRPVEAPQHLVGARAPAIGPPGQRLTDSMLAEFTVFGLRH